MGFYQKKAGDIVYLELTPSSAIAIAPPAVTLGNIVTNAKIIVKIDDEFKLFTYTAASKTYAVDSTSKDVYVFEKVAEDQTYLQYTALISAPTDDNVLFECYNGTCRQTKGYLLVGEKMYSNDSGAWVDVSTSAITTCTEATNEGKIKIGTDLELCHKANESLVMTLVSSSSEPVIRCINWVKELSPLLLQEMETTISRGIWCKPPIKRELKFLVVVVALVLLSLTRVLTTIPMPTTQN